MPPHILTLSAAAAVLGFSGPLPHGSEASRPLPVASVAAAALADAAPARPAFTSRGADLAEAALDVLMKHVRRQSHPDALRLAFQAYHNFRAAHPEQVRKPYLYFVDYGLDSRTPRGYVFDMRALKLVDGPFTVAHGRGSSVARDGVPTRFTNIRDSATSSLGLYLAQETYAFSGTSGGQRYRSTGLRLHGLSDRFNGAARARGIVVHGAPYVTSQHAGRSEGCPAMEESRAQELIPRISNGGLVFLFSPSDAGWMREDPWLRGASPGGSMASR
jgi:hypothetical protein